MILGEAVFSNLGGTATLVGDPPNILVGIAADLSFNTFIEHLAIPVALAAGVSLLLSRFIYRSWVKTKPERIEDLLKIEERKYIKDEKRMKILLILLIIMIALFATEQITGIPVAFVALIGGTISLAISRYSPQEVFEAVEWPTLVFFISLFILVGGLDDTGLLSDMATGIATISQNPMIIAIIILWVAGLTSSVVDNIPITAALIPVVSYLTGMYHTGILWWALIMGADIGGNITPIGSSAGVITIGLAKKLGYEVENKEWFRIGATTGVASLAVGTLSLFFIGYL